MRGHAEAFENACRAVEHFKNAACTRAFLLCRPGFCRSGQFQEILRLGQRLGVAEIRVMEVKPSGREACRGASLTAPCWNNPEGPVQRSRVSGPSPLSGLSTWLEKDPALDVTCRFEYLFITSTGEVQPCEATQISFGNIKDEPFPISINVCARLFRPIDGLHPHGDVFRGSEFPRDERPTLVREKSVISSRIMEGFQEIGIIPGAYRSLWSMYESRLKAYHNRRVAKNARSPHETMLQTKPND